MAAPWNGGAKTKPAIDIPGLMDTFLKDYATAKGQRQKRYGEGLRLMQDAMAQFAPGGAFEQAGLASYSQGKQRAMASGMQSLVSSGLAGTSNPMAMETGYEQQVGTPFRLGLAAESSNRLATALQNTASYMAGFPDIYPDAGQLSYLATGGFGSLLSADRLNAQTAAANQGLNAFGEPFGSRLGSIGTGGIGGDVSGGRNSSFTLGSPYAGSSQGGGGGYVRGSPFTPVMDYSDATYGAGGGPNPVDLSQFNVPTVAEEIGAGSQGTMDQYPGSLMNNAYNAMALKLFNKSYTQLPPAYQAIVRSGGKGIQINS